MPPARHTTPPTKSLLSPTLLSLALLSCTFLQNSTAQTQQPDPTSPPPPISPQQLEFFESKVRPLLIEHCYECHSGTEQQGGLRLDHRQALLQGGESGLAIDPKNPDQSRLLTAIRYNNPDLQMPPKGKLSPNDISILNEWILQGAPDPRTAAPEQTDNAMTQAPHANQALGMSIEDGRRFWSMQNLTKPKVPSSTHPDPNSPPPQNPIDAFIAEKLHANNLIAPPLATRRQLLKRLSLDLIGLPPTADEYTDFEQDTAPEAIERQIDRLLNSPQYGVRYARHWLDVARYADSNGLDENIAYGNAWRYRDYVIDAMNQDKPFNRFIEEQIAGDLLTDANRETITATGYLVLGAKVLAEPDREKLTMDTIDEQIDAIGKTFLGMTLGCVRCHDHKFDPIKQKDYYALAAIFKGTKTFGDSNFGAIKHWNETSFASPEEKQHLKTIDAQVAEKNASWNKLKNEAIQKLREQVRKDAAEYLAVAATLSTEATLNDWARAGAASDSRPLPLHPRVLANARRFLDAQTDNPLFATWREKAANSDSEAIRSHYRDLFAQTDQEWQKAKAADANVKHLTDPMLEAARNALSDPAGFLAIPAKMEHALDPTTVAVIHKTAEEARIFESSAPDETTVMAVSDKAVVDGIPIHIRGSYRNLGPVVERGFPEVMLPEGSTPIFPTNSSGRLELAKWIASPNHPLTARVIVNRIWRWHFGTGLVESTENFGALGSPPSHPELLDYLARWFIESGWSIKALHRLILTSSTYQMSSGHPNFLHAQEIDAANRLLWHFPLQRLDAEQIRDTILFASGNLDLKIGGKSVPLRNRQFVFDHTSIDHTQYDSHRRTIFLPVIRNHLFSLFEQFDFPDPTMPVGDRQSTTVAPQMLMLMNAPWVLQSAEKIAQQSGEIASDPTTRVQWIVIEILGRQATNTELQRILEFIAQPNNHSQLQWELVCQNLLICSESMYVP